MLRPFCPPFRRRTPLSALLGPLLAIGCLPDPDIKVPDFKPSGVVDLATSRLDAGPPPDSGRVSWLPDQSVRNGQTLRAIISDPTGQVFAVGHVGTILRRGGSSWISEPAVDGAKVLTSNLYGAASSGSDLYAVGETGVVVKRTTDKWQQEAKELGLTTSLFAITATTGGDLYAVGDAGTILRKPMGGVWSRDSIDAGLANADFRAVVVSPPDELLAVGLGGVIARRSAGKWSPDSVPVDAGDRGNYYGVVVTSESVFVAGEYGRVLRRDADKWRRESTVPQSGQTVHFLALGASGSDLTVVGTLGTIQRRDGSTKTWTLEDSSTLLTLSGLSTAQPLRAVGAQGTVVVRK